MSGFFLFRFRDIPVFVSGWYLILMAYFFLLTQEMSRGLIWIGVVSLSLLVHEFGHGLVARRFNLEPRILLHGWGGLCSHRPAKRDRDDAFIVIMGPLAGLILGGISLGVEILLESSQPGYLAARPLLASFLGTMIWVNLAWSVLNLIPMWPLDGGQLFRLALKQKLSPERTHRITHTTGTVIGVAGVLLALSFQSFFAAILSGFIAYSNFQQLRNSPTRTRRPKGPNRRATEIYTEAVMAMQDHQWEEALRLGHLMRAEHLDAQQTHDMWELLVVASTNLGEFEEALRFSKRAPDTAPVEQSRERCLEALAEQEESGPLD